MSLSDTDQLVMDQVEKHYENSDSPYYLAELGLFFRSQNIEVPEGVQFKDYLKIRFNQRLIVVQDEKAPAKIAIATPEKAEIVERQLAGVGSDLPGSSRIDYARLPFSLVAAFCKIPQPGNRLYFRIRRPFQYRTSPDRPDDNYVEIEDQFRPTNLAGTAVREISLEAKRTIYQHIERWAEAHSIDLRTMYFDLGTNLGGQYSRKADDNALQRLIDAQEPEMRNRIRIPGDIASTLMGLP